MLCLPALTPVANDAHAVGDSGECVVPSGMNVPPVGEPLHVRQLAFVHPLAGPDVGSMPSKPIANTRCVVRRTGLCVLAPAQKQVASRQPQTTAARLQRINCRRDTARL